MASWRKRLSALMADPGAKGYSYAELATLLENLGFELSSPSSGSSHRKWRLRRAGRPMIVVGLVEKGSGHVKECYVRDMRDTLRGEGLAK